MMAVEQEKILDDFAFLVSETDEKGIIKFANDDFCNVAEYALEDLIGQPHSIVRHEDMPKLAFQSLWDTIKKNEIWTGYVKNSVKNGGYYWVFAIVYPFESCDGSRGYMSCRRKASVEEIKTHVTLYEQWKSTE
jgi:aerotaxis receptor